MAYPGPSTLADRGEGRGRADERHPPVFSTGYFDHLRLKSDQTNWLWYIGGMVVLVSWFATDPQDCGWTLPHTSHLGVSLHIKLVKRQTRQRGY